MKEENKLNTCGYCKIKFDYIPNSSYLIQNRKIEVCNECNKYELLLRLAKSQTLNK